MSKMYRLEFTHVVDVVADTECEAVDRALQALDGEGVGECVSCEEIGSVKQSVKEYYGEEDDDDE